MKDLAQSKLVAIVGGSGAGKSWLTYRLQKIFSGEVNCACLDDFYLDRSHLSPSRRARVNYDHPRAIDWQSVAKFLQDCRNGHPCKLPHYDFKAHSRLSQWEPWFPKPLVLVEGLWLIWKPAIRCFFDFAIYLDCPASVRLHRRLVRDLAERGRSRASIARQFKNTVAPMHDVFVAPQARWADIVLHEPVGESDIQSLYYRLRGLLTNSRADWRPRAQTTSGAYCHTD